MSRKFVRHSGFNPRPRPGEEREGDLDTRERFLPVKQERPRVLSRLSDATIGYVALLCAKRDRAGARLNTLRSVARQSMAKTTNRASPNVFSFNQ